VSSLVDAVFKFDSGPFPEPSVHLFHRTSLHILGPLTDAMATIYERIRNGPVLKEDELPRVPPISGPSLEASTEINGRLRYHFRVSNIHRSPREHDREPSVMISFFP